LATIIDSARAKAGFNELLNEYEAAAMLSCSVAALRRWRLLGRGPRYVKIERLVRYRPEDLRAYVEGSIAA
jgi:hypothetical protein